MGSGGALPPQLVLFDGVCGLCDATVRWLLDKDIEKKLQFSPLQGDTAKEILARHPEIPSGLDSILLVETRDGEETVLWRSRAALKIASYLPGYRWLWSLRFIPAFLSDLGYRFIAKIRYRVWGKHDQCRIPTPDERARFLP